MSGVAALAEALYFVRLAMHPPRCSYCLAEDELVRVVYAQPLDWVWSCPRHLEYYESRRERGGRLPVI